MIQFQSEHVVVFQSALFQTTSTVIQTDDLVLIVDPNWLPGEIEFIKNHLQSIRYAHDERPFYLLFTHSDYDHIIGYKAFPGAKVIASKAFSVNREKESVLEQIRAWDDEYYIIRDYPIEYPVVDVEVEKDGQSFSIGETRLTFYLSPGHNPDGIFTVIEWPSIDSSQSKNLQKTGIWLAGDYLCEVEFPFIYHSSLAYEETISKVEGILSNHEIGLLVPGHGKIATDTQEILKRKKESITYIHNLRNSVANGSGFDIQSLWQRYSYRRGMEDFHQKNVELISKELMTSHQMATSV